MGQSTDVTVATGVTVAMRDGTRLAADVYRPTGDGPWPVLLMRQPYGRDIASTVVYAQPAWFARQGYLVVIQDVRGRGDSEGVFYPFRHEEEDGFDTVEWAAKLPGSNGRVGMYGFSYQASTQLFAAAARPPSLRAIAPHMTAFDLYGGWFYRQGLLQLQSTLAWGNQMLREDVRRAGPPELSRRLDQSWLNPSILCSSFPLASAAPVTDAAGPGYVRDWIEHDRHDDYWRAFDLTARLADLDLPMFHLAGWYDYYLRGSLGGYAAARQAVRSDQFLLCGPWVHIPWGRNLGGSDLGAEARVDTDALLVRWFDHWLKDAPRSEDTRGATYFMLGGNRWRHASSWPPPGTTTGKWFLVSEGRANSAFGDGRLSIEGPGGPADTFNYDPEVPVLAPGGAMNGALTWGPADLSSQQQGNNLLVFTATLDQPLEIAGGPRCRLFVRSTAPDTAFVARLSRVTTAGRVVFLTLGAACLREGSRREDGVVELVVDLDHTACRFEAGEGVRLDIASSAFPLLARHPNTTASPNRLQSPAEFRRALQTVFHDAESPSVLELPVLP